MTLFPQREPVPGTEQLENNLLEAVKTAHEAKCEGHHPFGSVLIGPDSKTILLKQGNIDTLNHAEMTLCRNASKKFEPTYLWKCTLYTNFEPCAMCAGAIYWSNIGRVVYGLTEAALLELTGSNEENMTMNLQCRTVFNSGQKDIQVIGPLVSLKEEILKDHIDFWIDNSEI